MDIRDYIALWSPWLVLAAAAAVALYPTYIAMPLRAGKLMGVRREQIYTNVEMHSFPSDFAETLLGVTPIMAASGFKAFGHVRVESSIQEAVEAYSSIWSRQATLDWVQIVGVWIPAKSGETRARVTFHIETLFSDDTVICTTNSRHLPLWPNPPGLDAIRCPGVENFALLYRFHSARVEQDRGNRMPIPQEANDAISLLQRDRAEAFARLLEIGYYRVDAEKDIYVPTVKGALLMAWGGRLFPLKQLRAHRSDRRSDRALRRLGFGALAEFQAAQFQPSAPPPLE